MNEHYPAGLIPVLAALVAASCAGGPPAERADLILTNGRIHTMSASQPRAEALAVAAGRIVRVGGAAEVMRARDDATRVVDLGGRMVLPAFQDSHIHLVMGGVELLACNLSGLETKEAVFARIREYASAHPDLPWVTGGGWDLPLFPQADPRREDLDALVPDRPAFMDSADGHSAWVNSRALALAGVTADTPDPEGGRIERDPETGQPTGTLRESAAGLVERFVPELSPQDYIKGLKAGLALANRFGIASIIEASADVPILDAYAALDRDGELTVRVLASLYVDTRKGVRRRRGSPASAGATRAGGSGRPRPRSSPTASWNPARPRSSNPTSTARAIGARRSSDPRPSTPWPWRSTGPASRSTSTPSATGPSACRSTPSRQPDGPTVSGTCATTSPTSSSSIPPTSPASGGWGSRPISRRSGPTPTPTSPT